MLKKKLPMSKQPKKSAAPVMKENNRAMEVDTVIIRNMVVMDTALLVDTDIPMEAMVTEACVNTVEVTENMEDTEITATNRIMVEAMVVTAVSNLEVMAVTVATNTEVMVGMEVTDLEAMVVTAAISLEAMAVTVATNSEVMEATEVVMATLIPIIPQTKMNTSQKLIF